MLQFSFSLCDAVDLNALNKHLDDRCALWEFSPCEWQAIQADAELLLWKTADHHLEQADTKRIHIFKHEHFHLFSLSDLFFVFCERPVVRLGRKR